MRVPVGLTVRPGVTHERGGEMACDRFDGGEALERAGFGIGGVGAKVPVCGGRVGRGDGADDARAAVLLAHDVVPVGALVVGVTVVVGVVAARFAGGLRIPCHRWGGVDASSEHVVGGDCACAVGHVGEVEPEVVERGVAVFQLLAFDVVDQIFGARVV